MTDSSHSVAGDWLGLAGRVCVVTGAGSGSGTAHFHGTNPTGSQTRLPLHVTKSWNVNAVFERDIDQVRTFPGIDVFAIYFDLNHD